MILSSACFYGVFVLSVDWYFMLLIIGYAFPFIFVCFFNVITSQRYNCCVLFICFLSYIREDIVFGW